MVEPQIVVLVVAGSSPVGHPKSGFRDWVPFASDLGLKSSICRTRIAPPRAPFQTSRIDGNIGIRQTTFLNECVRAIGRADKENYKSVTFLLQRILHICNLARHVHTAQRHMAIDGTITII